MVFESKGGEWGLAKVLDDGFKDFKTMEIEAGLAETAMDHFKMSEMTSSVKLPKQVISYARNTKHENMISNVDVYKSKEGEPKTIATADPNGKIHFWNL